jgi:AraC-like DNA-binding protein
MKILIKNMVCDRCILVIRNCLNEVDLHPITITLGEIVFSDDNINELKLQKFNRKIGPLGFEIINDKKSKLIESIKNKIVALVQNKKAGEKIKLSEYITKQIYHDYTHLSNLFSVVEGVTIEQYFINHKIEKTKELLVYDEMNLSEIADHLGYSSVAHLSTQFKKITGMTPTHFKKLRNTNLRLSLDKV